MNLVMVTHGTPRSRYDAKIRAIASQYRTAEFGLDTVAQAIRDDIAKIKRANVAVASNSYTVKVADQYTAEQRIEITNVVPGPARLIVTLREFKNQSPGV